MYKVQTNCWNINIFYSILFIMLEYLT